MADKINYLPRIQELREKGLTYREIGEELGISPQLAHRWATNSPGSTTKRRMEALEALGPVCVRCGFEDVRALQIDHVNGGGADEFKAMGNYRMYKKVCDPVNHHLYQVLCANCNWIKRHENDENPNRRRKNA